MAIENPGKLPERVAALEARLSYVENDIKELRGEVRGIHGRINDLIENEIHTLKRTRLFWLQVFGAGSAGAVILEALIRYVVPKLIGG